MNALPNPLYSIPTPPRAWRLYVVRESAEWDLLVFDAMREHTYASYRDDPDTEAVRRVGLAPLHCESSFEVLRVDAPGGPLTEDITVEVIVRGRTRVVLFRVGATWHLWCQASAYRTDLKGLNEFTEILIEVIARLRPREVVAANFSRLIRSQDQGNRLATALSGNVDVVRAGQIDFAFAGPNALIGKMTFGMFATIASMERDWIVTRLLAGKVAVWRRGGWLYGKDTVPFGYTFDAKTKQLVPDLSQRDAVAKMLLTLSSTTKAPRQMLRELAKAGVTTMRKHRRLNRRVSVLGIRAAREYIDSLYAWAPLWIAGEHLFRVTSPVPYVDELAGVPLVRADWDVPGRAELQLLTKVALPPGGWTDQSVLDAFRLAAITRSQERAARHHGRTRPLGLHVTTASTCPDLHDALLDRKAMRGRDEYATERRTRRRGNSTLPLFSGLGWDDGTFAYELQSAFSDTYRVVRWPLFVAKAGAQ